MFSKSAWRMLFVVLMISGLIFANGEKAYSDGSWEIRPVVTFGDVGAFSSLALDASGNVHISFFDQTNGDLKYVTNASGFWVNETLVYEASVGWTTSIGIDSSGYVHIAYYKAISETSGELVYATNVSGSWQTETVDSEGDVGAYASLAVDSSDQVHLSYYDWTNGDLKYATNGSGSWQSETVDSEGDVGGYGTAIAMDAADNAHIVYFDFTNYSVKYALNTSDTWSIETIDTYAGGFSDLVIDASGYVHISSYDWLNGGLRYTTNASGLWIGTDVDSGINTGWVGWGTSIGLDSANRVHIGYYAYDSGDLKYATNASGTWVAETVDSEGDVGWFASLALDAADTVHLSYYDETNGDLKYAQRQAVTMVDDGFMASSDLWIKAVIKTEEKGDIVGVWQKGGEDITAAGDRVIWGHFYASPDDVTWGSRNNPDLYVKIWFDHGGRLDVNFFHVSVPDIEVYSDYPYDGTLDAMGTTTMVQRYVKHYYEGGFPFQEVNTEDGVSASGYSQSGNPVGDDTINDLRIGSMINTVERGPIEAEWRLGGQDTTDRGDQVVWGFFYASPDQVTWGSQENPDLYVKIWFDVSGRIDVNFFHVSVPDIEVYSDYPNEGSYDQTGTTIMADRYTRQEYQRADQPSTYTNSLGMTFVSIPAGTFMMGSPEDELGRGDDEVLHQVTLTQSYYMQTTEVTQSQWETVMGSNPSYFSGCPDCPVESVSWYDVQDFITALNARGEGTYRLPTEAEWEYACRAGTTTALANGDITVTGCEYDPNLDQMGWYCSNAGNTSHPVGQKAPNAWGLYDMHGNVEEWCQDWYGDYPTEPVTDPVADPSAGIYPVIRGGNMRFHAWRARCAYRGQFYPPLGESGIGFRLARDL